MRRRGLTLIELVMAMSVTTILMVGLGSVMLIAAKSLPDDDQPEVRAIDAGAALDRIADDVMTMTTAVVLESETLVFMVNDATGDGEPDAIRYEAVPASPYVNVTRTVNGSGAVVVATGLDRFQLAYETDVVDRTPRVLLVVHRKDGLLPTEIALRDWMQSNGYDVRLISDDRDQDDLDAAIADRNVVFVASTVDSGAIGSKLTWATTGIVCSDPYLYDELGLAVSSTTYADDMLRVTDVDHPILSGAGMWKGPWGVADTFTGMTTLGTPRADGDLLGTAFQASDPAFLAIERGDLLTWSSHAPGRRVALPFGGPAFDIQHLNGVGRGLVQNSIRWAASSRRIRSLRVTIESAGVPYSTDVLLVGPPEA